MARLFLNTYTPLVTSEYGRHVSQSMGLPPFIDGSIRREPDLQHQFPSISCLCRAGKFAPRLQVADVVVYLSKKGRYEDGNPHRRLAAVIQVARLFDTHAEAAQWFRRSKLPLPSNCMVDGNPPLPLNMSHRITVYGGCSDGDCVRKWDSEYAGRARQYGRFVVCTPIHVDLGWSAPRVIDQDLKVVFGKVPGTQNPGALPIDRLNLFMQRLGIAARLSAL